MVEHFEKAVGQYTFTEYERDEGVELIFDEPIDQDSDEPLDTINKALLQTYGENATIDWRDDQTCWVY